ncbi:hypothetical protein CCM_01833 [Cordyceps militaris CM01]|uniref:Uncharacterized protein n=1 Tax=Cordyceps militaris (strain CM01) TaxID=983644 RepID=G3J7W2_CORMM|nr:uncharacterized protein CCM_01833 [Cordyceps militaris CM01]EGX97173.1 hypothetical protein CCM_01833 [Cordyceps militaris CM01]
MPRKTVKSEASTASPDPAPARSTPVKAGKTTSTPAKSASKKEKDTPSSKSSTTKTSKDKDAAAIKQRRQRRASSTQLLAGALAAAVYAAVVSLALRFVLPRVLVLHFRGIPTVAPAYAASFFALLPTAAVFGGAASKFLFAPYVTTGRSKEDDRIRQFDPVRASLAETVWWNVWGYTLRGRIVITRTALVTGMTAVSTFLACAVAMDGVTGWGAAAYALVWASATAATGLALGLVGQE